MNRILVLILCMGFVSVAWGQQPAGKGRSDWTEFHRTNMERWNPYEKVLNVHNVGKLSAKWSYAAGLTVYSSPAVANGVVYIGGGWTNNNVYAFGLKKGRK
jgi:glucose dehydrogenase